MKINNYGYELNKATASDTQGDHTNNLNIVTHTSNNFLTKKLSCGTIRKVSTLPSPENLIVLAPQKLMTPMLNKIFADARSVNAWTGRMTQQVSRTGVNKTILGNIGHTCGISETSFPDLIEIIRDTDPPCSLNVKHEIGDIRQYTSLDLRNSNKLDTSIYWKFANNLVAPPIFTEIIGDKLSVSSSWDIYSRCSMDLASDPVNIPAPKFVDLGLSTINALDKSASPSASS